MTINRVLLYLNCGTQRERRYVRAFRWREQAQAVVDRIEAVVGEDPLLWYLPSASIMADDESPFCMQVLAGGFKLEIDDLDLDTVSVMLVDALRDLAAGCAAAADKIEDARPQ